MARATVPTGEEACAQRHMDESGPGVEVRNRSGSVGRGVQLLRPLVVAVLAAAVMAGCVLPAAGRAAALVSSGPTGTGSRLIVCVSAEEDHWVCSGAPDPGDLPPRSGPARTHPRPLGTRGGGETT